MNRQEMREQQPNDAAVPGKISYEDLRSSVPEGMNAPAGLRYPGCDAGPGGPAGYSGGTGAYPGYGMGPGSPAGYGGGPGGYSGYGMGPGGPAGYGGGPGGYPGYSMGPGGYPGYGMEPGGYSDYGSRSGSPARYSGAYGRDPYPAPAQAQPAPAGRPLQRLHGWAAVLFFIGVMTLFYFVLPIPMMLLGIPDIPSLILQQLFLLAASILFAVILREDLRTVFPVRKPKISGVFGIIVIYAGTYLLEIVISTFLMYIASDSLMEIQESMFGDITGWKYVIYMFLIAILPTFCEEALNRGVVFHGLKKDLRSRTLIILISGILFGVSHFYPVRMLAPAVLGCIMAWIMLETDNLFYTGLLHLLNNGFVMLISGLSQALMPDEFMEQSAEMAASLGSFETGMAMIVYGLFAPLIIYCGCYLIRRSMRGKNTPFVEPGRGVRAVLGIVLPVILIMAAAAVIMIAG